MSCYCEQIYSHYEVRTRDIQNDQVLKFERINDFGCPYKFIDRDYYHRISYYHNYINDPKRRDSIKSPSISLYSDKNESRLFSPSQDLSSERS